MLAVVKTPRIKIEIKGRISKKLLDVLKEEYGSEVQLVPDEEDEKLDVFETDWYKGMQEKGRVIEQKPSVDQSTFREFLVPCRIINY